MSIEKGYYIHSQPPEKVKRCLSRMSGKLSCTVLRRGKGSNPFSLVEYTSEAYRRAVEKYGIKQSMNSAGGRCHDNAKCESVWGRFKAELIYDRYDTSKMSMNDVKSLVWYYFMSYWNNRRICSVNGGLPPAVKRQRYYDGKMAAV